jgi:3-isopropylmalate dehydrogenase
MMRVVVLPGDGIGKEVTAEAVKVLKEVLGAVVPHTFVEGVIGDDSIRAGGDPLPAETLELARDCDAILLGGVGVPADEQRPLDRSAGGSLLALRKHLGLFANFRPVFLFPEIVGASSLRPDVVEGVDLMILRELNGDLYFGRPRGYEKDASGGRSAFNTMRYTEAEIARVAHTGFRAARSRRHKLCSVDKANVLETMALWREVVTEVGKLYPDVALTHLHIDAAAMELIRKPRAFDVIVTGNMFGDILSDEAAMLTGSIGMLPSASLRDDRMGLYEPVHGTAPDIAGRNIANPLGAILSAAMMLRHSFDLEVLAREIETGVRSALAARYRTADISEPGCMQVGTKEMGDAVLEAIRRGRAERLESRRTG